MTDGRIFAIAEVAKTIGVSTGTIRAWEEQGLLSPLRDEQNRRMYTADDLVRLRTIRWWRRVRQVNAAAIRAILDEEDGARAESESTWSAPATGEEETDGAYYRGLRKAAGLTLREVSARSGLSVSFISSIERGVGAMSPTSKARLTSALMGNPPVDVQPHSGTHSAGTGRVLQVAPGIQYEWLSELNGLLEPQLVTLAPGAASEGTYQHDGEEFLFVLEGRMRLWLGSDVLVLSQQDSTHFSSHVAHRWANDAATTTRALWITTERGVWNMSSTSQHPVTDAHDNHKK
ncbi:MerR family transcriptional regulator [Acrocarpospora macrocephala]|uniref:MerR family transcriptional regulator n=1 Tax=Acrocarpospora macrocephala TaxID=150177 RepID=A0A5M3WWN8_9ACTN|nr:MerR family transcriptional regulator [Acrocarpospora macrocephala]GES12359.1 MerR family transcriptional regulator [Acrocarpospora macrocephala]